MPPGLADSLQIQGDKMEDRKNRTQFKSLCYTVEMKETLQVHAKFACIKNITMRTFSDLRSLKTNFGLLIIRMSSLPSIPTPTFCVPSLLQFKLGTRQFLKNKFKRRVSRLHLFKLIF